MREQFGAFTASELYCPKCKRSQPVREKLLLILPTGELYQFLCTQCAASLGERTVTGPKVAAPVKQSSARSAHLRQRLLR
jgi:hypothetical protein